MKAEPEPSQEIRFADNEDRLGIIQLLRLNKLPYSDLPEKLNHFFVLEENNTLIACGGIEIYEKAGLIRSMAVNPASQNQGLGTSIYQYLLKHAMDNQLQSLYLLTETAEGYFLNKGFKKINRADAPKELDQSSQFSTVCPASAAFMMKYI
jgi:amino-acid N-acetyltransferase